MRKLENEDSYTVEKHKELVTQELLNREMNQDEINMWVDAIE